ncbi:hypothetical protein PoB_007212600 [Plakobranchus ocellatus]|uniref:Uncharacterized protein n=1 Tax=Plakobranchus ocellatus TaxID=259542 RepID=A0AAV4DNA6_9GAST|nr:hypothetical protein PoB_007212600 [Plakobranchus ocellatus]
MLLRFHEPIPSSDLIRNTDRLLPLATPSIRRSHTNFRFLCFYFLVGRYTVIDVTSKLQSCFQYSSEKAENFRGKKRREKKHALEGLNRVRFGITLAVAEYNMGSLDNHSTRLQTYLSHNLSGPKKRDSRRIKRAETAHQAPAKKRHEVRKQAEQQVQQDAVRADGGPSYIARGF